MGERRARRGKMKEKVLPEPVGAQARMSRFYGNVWIRKARKSGSDEGRTASITPQLAS
jgi:hypothetical protein